MGKRILTWFAAGILFLVVLGIAMTPLEEPAQQGSSASAAVSVPVPVGQKPSPVIPAVPSVQQPASPEPAPQPVQAISTSAESSGLAAAFADTPPPEAVKVKPTVTVDGDYLLNTNTGKFHIPTCVSVTLMNDSNKLPFSGPREEVITLGYSPCMNCNP